MCWGLPAQQQPSNHRWSSDRLIWSHPVLHHVCGKSQIPSHSLVLSQPWKPNVLPCILWPLSLWTCLFFKEKKVARCLHTQAPVSWKDWAFDKLFFFLGEKVITPHRSCIEELGGYVLIYFRLSEISTGSNIYINPIMVLKVPKWLLICHGLETSWCWSWLTAAGSQRKCWMERIGLTNTQYSGKVHGAQCRSGKHDHRFTQLGNVSWSHI